MNIIHLITVFYLCSLLFSCNETKAIPPEEEKPAEEIPVEEEPHNANFVSNTYTGFFLYGSNMGWKNNNWTDEDVADILTGNNDRDWEGIGVNSLRPALYEDFVETYGYTIRVNAFKHYASKGAKANVVFIGDRPSEAHRERMQHTTTQFSQSYENLYEPIWDDGKDGTPINENNYYAAYVYKLVQTYKDYVKFWEIKNEPDFTYTGNGDRKSGDGNNWWDKDPSPGDLSNWNAPVQSYIRLLRVSYEVIKSIDKDAFVCIGGIGYESFLDAVLRNTDNPDGGKVTDEYPYKGGAWFDCLNYHIYPMYYLREWKLGFQFYRHSDAAVDVVVKRNTALRERLQAYGYGVGYPAKEIIITEVNIPSTPSDDHIGSNEAQRNFLMKTAIVAQKNGVCGVYPFRPWDAKETGGDSFDYMGFYRPIPDSPDGAQLRVKESGIGWHTTSTLLRQRTYDAGETARLSLSVDIEGAAFYSPDTKDYIYVLWARTSKDKDETATAVYQFPESMPIGSMTITSWDGKRNTKTGNTVALTGAPVFIQVQK